MPLEGEPPIKASDHGLVGLHVIFKGVPVNGVDHRAHNGAGVLPNPATEREVASVWPRGVPTPKKKPLKGTFPGEALSIQARTRSGSPGRSAPPR